jgi:MarR family transcriptional regulator, organic hydroperoxide resistance regulator
MSRAVKEKKRTNSGAGQPGITGASARTGSRIAPTGVTQAEGDALVTLPALMSPADRIVLEIRKLIASSIFFNAQAAEKIGLGLTDMQMLHMLQLYGPTTPSRLATGTGLSSGGVTVALDRLEREGFIRRERNPADRRSLLIQLVPTRLVHVATMYEGVEAETRRQLSTLSARDLEAVIRFFEALASIRGPKA